MFSYFDFFIPLLTTFSVIENTPLRLAEIKGISRDRAKEIGEEFRKRAAEREALISLEKYGMTTAECLRVFKIFGKNSVATVERNPYLLCSESCNRHCNC